MYGKSELIDRDRHGKFWMAFRMLIVSFDGSVRLPDRFFACRFAPSKACKLQLRNAHGCLDRIPARCTRKLPSRVCALCARVKSIFVLLSFHISPHRHTHTRPRAFVLNAFAFYSIFCLYFFVSVYFKTVDGIDAALVSVFSILLPLSIKSVDLPSLTIVVL